ncbi:MAG: MarR family transcriptional regulator [Sphingobacteriales bacterium]|nr:MAG: MarR family transcriptional regulator [Sphingobacteriales bacterium]
MSEIVDLVNKFDKFQKKHPGGDVAGFCRYFLAKQADKHKGDKSFGPMPPTPESQLAKIMGRLLSVFSVYHEAALAKTRMPFREGFYMVNWLKHHGEMKKTEFINELLIGYTTGMDAINKLIKEGLINERNHDTDKRAKLISVSPYGEEVLLECYPLMQKVTRMTFHGMHPEAIQFCINLLTEPEIRRTRNVAELKGLDFDEMYERVMSEE